MREQSQNDQVPATSREELKKHLIRNPQTGEEDYLAFQARCVRIFRPHTGNHRTDIHRCGLDHVVLRFRTRGAREVA